MFAMLVIVAGLVCANTSLAVTKRTTAVLGSPLGTCTAWPVIAQGTLKWMAVSHCIQDSTLPFLIDGVPALVSKLDDSLVVLSRGPQDVTPFKIADRLPAVGDPVIVLSHPYGGPQVFLRGFFSAPDVPTPIRTSLFQVPSTAGASGSPILDEHDRIVGVVTAIPCATNNAFCPMVLSVKLEAIQEFVK